MKKKNIIAWSIVVGVVVAMVLICTMVFTLSKIDFQITAQITVPGRSRLFTQGQTVESVQNNMLTSANFKEGGNLLVMTFDKQIENIEKANPYVKVEKIVRRFPNKITVYYSEREAVALLPIKNVEKAYFVVDTQLKILDYVTQSAEGYFNQNLSQYTLPVIDYYSYTVPSELKAGDVIDNASLKNHLQLFVSGAFSAYNQPTALYEDIMGFITDIKFYLQNNQDNRCLYTLKANTNADVIFDTYNINERFFNKIALSWNLFINNYKATNVTSDITLVVHINNAHKIVIADTVGNVVDSEK